MQKPPKKAVCKLCLKETAIPTDNPPFGSHLVCEHCFRSLIETRSKDGGLTPLSVSPESLRRLTGFTGRSLIHPACPHCGEINYAVVTPASGRTMPWYISAEADPAKAFSLQTDCVKCSKPFFIEWDEPPLQEQCALCRKKLKFADRSQEDGRFCVDCAGKLSKVRARRRNTAAPGKKIRLAIIVSFSRALSERERKLIARADKDIQDAPVAAFVLSGKLPEQGHETAMVTVDVATSAARKLLGYEIELEKVTHQITGDKLLVKLWE